MTSPLPKRAAYSVAQLAQRWGVSPGHIYGMIRSGALQYFKLQTLIRVRVEEVERIECASNSTVENGPLSEPIQTEGSGADLFVPPTVPRQKGVSRTFAPRRQGRR